MPGVSHDEDAVPTTTAFRRSLRASRARRSRAAAHRRRSVRGRGAVLLAGGLMVLGAGGAVAAETGGFKPSSKRSSAEAPAASSKTVIKAVQRKLGLKADGVAGPKTRSALRRYQRRNDLTVDGRIGPQTLEAMGIATSTRDDDDDEGAEPGAVSAQMKKIARCESGGDPTAVSASGRYRGKYQFDRPTWRSVGGEGDPADASEAEQDRRAAALMKKRGPGAWPNCA